MNGNSSGVILLELIVYIIETLPLFVIARRSAHPLAWLAWIPFANLWLMCDMTDMSLAWILLILIPFIGGAILTIMLWMRIVENTNKPSWLGILMIIPVVNLAIMYYVAFVDNGNLIE